MERRKFIKQNGLLIGGFSVAPTMGFGSSLFTGLDFESKRPAPGKRTFISQEVENTIKKP